MSTLNAYLEKKRHAVEARQQRIATGDARPADLRVVVNADHLSGVRHVRVRGHEILSDSLPDFAGADQGPSAIELQLGALGACVTHIFLIQAAARGLALDSIEVEVSARLDPRAGLEALEPGATAPSDIAYLVRIASPAASSEIAALFAEVEQICPILNLLRNLQTIRASLEHRQVEVPLGFVQHRPHWRGEDAS